VFSFFKLLDLRGFADAYRSYDLVARAVPAWAPAYPFVELALGLAYLVDFKPMVTNATTLVLMLVGAAGGLYWQNRASIASTAGELKNRRSAVDLLLWAGGSKKTFNQVLRDRLDQAQRDSAYQFDHAKPAFKSEFENVDFSNLSNSWNGAMNGSR